MLHRRHSFGRIQLRLMTSGCGRCSSGVGKKFYGSTLQSVNSVLRRSSTLVMHCLTAAGVHPDRDKLRALMDMKVPEN